MLTPSPRAADPDATVVCAGRRSRCDGGGARRPGDPAADPAADATQRTPRPGTGKARGGATGPLTVGDTFGRYTIVKLLGIGGMGAVYQAWDKELEVVVALKVIRPEALTDPAAEEEIERRFKRELLLARQVTHRNVVRIHDLGEIDGIKYITMTYVDGKDLSTVLKESGRLSISITLRIMKAVVSGLVAAHAAGVVHRDLKPANIMIGHDGEALIMDFGIARSTGGPAEVSAPPKDPGLDEIRPTGRYTEATVLGSIVGTVEYMAPEQARGEAVDQRADIYTTGLILYDMLIGKRRAEGPGTALDQLRARMEGPLPDLKTLAPDVPDALAAIVTRAIEPDPANRYQATTELFEALEALDEHGVPRPIKRIAQPAACGRDRGRRRRPFVGRVVVLRRRRRTPARAIRSRSSSRILRTARTNRRSTARSSRRYAARSKARDSSPPTTGTACGAPSPAARRRCRRSLTKPRRANWPSNRALASSCPDRSRNRATPTPWR